MKKSRRTFAVLCTLLFTICVFSVTAFATDGGTGGKVTEAPKTETSTSEVSSSASKASSEVSSKASSASSKTSFAKPTSSKSSTVSSKKPTVSANTQQSKVNRAASQAQAAVSDPDVLSSQNWGALLSSTASTAGTASAVSSAVSAAPANNGGGVSWLLIVGILLILLGAAGIGFFIYLQFFSGPKKCHGGPAAGKGDEPTEFVDINSSSDGIQHRELDDDTRSFDQIHPAGTVNRAPAPRAPQPQANPQPAPRAPQPQATQPAPRAPQPQAHPQPAPRPQSAPRPAVPSQGLEPHPKAQAEPVKDGKDFDWEKFFDENK